ncbi:heme-binding protein [Microbulbifer aestuariivivens]
MAIEEPKYTILEQAKPFELRIYEPRIVAEVQVSGSMDQASGRGFKLLADYIFGNNTARSGGSEKIAMTAPVAMEPRSEKISMTAPVSMEQSGGQWLVSFVMPSNFTMDTLPRPNNPAVNLREIPAKHYAVIRFSGLAGEEKVGSKTTELMEWMNNKGLQAVGEPELARYNPPWTLPFMRRNEIMVEYR